MISKGVILASEDVRGQGDLMRLNHAHFLSFPLTAYTYWCQMGRWIVGGPGCPSSMSEIQLIKVNRLQSVHWVFRE